MKEPVWVNRRALLLLHSESLAEFGGPAGIRDECLFDSALQRARMRSTYQPESSLAELTAFYGFGLARNHAMADGNKRIAFLAIGIFLRMNGYRLVADRAESVLVIEALAAGRLNEAELAEWVQAHIAAA